MHREHVFLVLLTIGTPALAQPIYRWTDDQGVTHYTNETSSVPSGQEAQLTSGEEISYISSSKPLPAAAAEPKPGPVSQPDFQLQDDSVEQQWRGAFRDAYARIAALEMVIENDRRILYRHGGELPLRFFSAPIYGGVRGAWLPDPWYDELNQRIRQNEAELKRAREDLNELERYASRHAVPREWRH